MTNDQLNHAGWYRATWCSITKDDLWGKRPFLPGTTLYSREAAERMAACGANSPAGVIDSEILGVTPQRIPKNLKSCDLLTSFIAYCRANPGYRFWQALRNWSGAERISFHPQGATDGESFDTFNWECGDLFAMFACSGHDKLAGGPSGASRPTCKACPNWQQPFSYARSAMGICRAHPNEQRNPAGDHCGEHPKMAAWIRDNFHG